MRFAIFYVIHIAYIALFTPIQTPRKKNFHRKHNINLIPNFIT